jgi:hypothetical protein
MLFKAKIFSTVRRKRHRFRVPGKDTGVLKGSAAGIACNSEFSIPHKFQSRHKLNIDCLRGRVADAVVFGAAATSAILSDFFDTASTAVQSAAGNFRVADPNPFRAVFD